MEAGSFGMGSALEIGQGISRTRSSRLVNFLFACPRRLIVIYSRAFVLVSGHLHMHPTNRLEIFKRKICGETQCHFMRNRNLRGLVTVVLSRNGL